MRIIDWKVLKTMQPTSRQHILRLENAGKWPRRVRLANNRIGWVYDEIVAHLEGGAADRGHQRPLSDQNTRRKRGH